MKAQIDKAKAQKARAKERAAECVSRVIGRLSVSVLGEPKIYGELSSSDKAELENFARNLRSIVNGLLDEAKELRNESRGGLI